MKKCGTKPPLHTLLSHYAKNDSLNGTTLPLRKIRQRESAVPKHRYGRYQIADIIIVEHGFLLHAVSSL